MRSKQKLKKHATLMSIKNILFRDMMIRYLVNLAIKIIASMFASQEFDNDALPLFPWP